MLLFHELGRFEPGDIHATWIESSRPIVPEIEAQIDVEWNRAREKLGEKLFDGPMCRMESWRRDSRGLHLNLSRTSYRVFLGTNLTHPELADRYGDGILARPIGVSCALLSRDGHLLMGERNASVAYYPNRLHPFAGALEPRESVDPFDDVRRELHEELNFAADDVAQIYCTGIVEDTILRHPEMIFTARSARSREQIQSQVHHAEHRASRAIRATADDIESALRRERSLTPVACASLLLHGRIEFGDEWFSRISAAFVTPR